MEINSNWSRKSFNWGEEGSRSGAWGCGFKTKDNDTVPL